MATKYQVGDEVLVIEDLELDKWYKMEGQDARGAYVTVGMKHRAGKVVTISEIDESIRGMPMYHIEGGSSSVFWTDGMFAGLANQHEDVDVSDDDLMSIIGGGL